MPSEKSPIHSCQPLLVVISGLSGAGKDTVVRELHTRGHHIHFVVTATSRPRRVNEVHGKDYVFVSEAEFQGMIEADELLEYALVYGQYKGVPKSQVRQALASGKDVIMRLDVQGAAVIKQRFPEAILIFIIISEETLMQRLQSRQTDSDEQVRVRLETARAEMDCLSVFDYAVENEDGRLADTVNTIEAIIRAEHHRVAQRQVKL